MEGAAARAKACGGATVGSSSEQPVLGYGVLAATLSGGKWRGTSGHAHLGIIGGGEVAAHSRNGELLFLKPGDSIGDAPVVLQL
jgi:hypothetical protein